MHHYHVHATCHAVAGQVVHFDGIGSCKFAIDSPARYQEFKRGLTPQFGISEDLASKLIIESLSFLHKDRKQNASLPQL